MASVPHIPESLVGRSAVILEGGVYRDGYLARINEAYPLVDVFGQEGLDRLRLPMTQSWDYLTHLIKGLAQEDSANNNLMCILHESARLGLWQPLTYNAANPKIQRDVVEALQLCEERGLVKVIDFPYQEVKTMKAALPSQRFVEYCAQRARQ